MADEVLPVPVPVVPPVVVPVPQTTDQKSDAAVPYVRAGLTILLVAALVAFYGLYKWCPDVLIVMASTAFGFYFSSRTPGSGATTNGVSK